MPGWLLALGGGRAILAALAVVAALAAGAWLYTSGRSAERVDGLERTIRTMGERDAIDRDISRQPDGAAADRLRRDWSRD